jgi:predicted nuclease with TOPRIM domain
MRQKNYAKEMARLQVKIDKKQAEIKELKAKYAEAESEYEIQKNKEVFDVMAQKGISASQAVKILENAQL